MHHNGPFDVQLYNYYLFYGHLDTLQNSFHDRCVIIYIKIKNHLKMFWTYFITQLYFYRLGNLLSSLFKTNIQILFFHYYAPVRVYTIWWDVIIMQFIHREHLANIGTTAITFAFWTSVFRLCMRFGPY